MHQEHSGLKTLLGEIETLRIKRQREMAHRSHSPWKRFTQQELNDEACPTYKNLLVGRSRRIPDRQTILAISDYLECTSDERNESAAGCRLPADPIRIEGTGVGACIGTGTAYDEDDPFSRHDCHPCTGHQGS